MKFCFLGEEEARVLLAGEGGEESDGEGRGEKRGRWKAMVVVVY